MVKPVDIISICLVIIVLKFQGVRDGGQVGGEGGIGLWIWGVGDGELLGLPKGILQGSADIGGAGPGAGVLVGVDGGPGDEGGQIAEEVKGEPKAPCVCSEVMVSSEIGSRFIGLNHGAGVCRDLWGMRGQHSFHGLDIFNVFNYQTFNGLVDNLSFEGLC